MYVFISGNQIISILFSLKVFIASYIVSVNGIPATLKEVFNKIGTFVILLNSVNTSYK
jgi:hypothetical protein